MTIITRTILFCALLMMTPADSLQGQASSRTQAPLQGQMQSTASTPGRTIVLLWDIPENTTSRNQQLDIFTRIGIKGIAINGIQDEQTVREVKARGFQLWIRSGNRFDFNTHVPPPETQLQELTDPLWFYRNAGLNVHGYIVQEYPFLQSGYENFLQTVTQSLGGIWSGPLHIIAKSHQLRRSVFKNETELPVSLIYSIESLADITEISDASGILFHASDQHPLNNTQFRALFEQTASSTTVFMQASEILGWQGVNPEALQILAAFSRDPNAVIALSTAPPTGQNDQLQTILLLLLWGTFLVFFMLSGGYHRSLIRYFTTHNFYINDIMMRRIKPGNEILISLILSLMSAGVLMVLFFQYSLDSTTIEFLNTILPFAYIISSGGIITQFLSGSLLIFALITPGLLWLSITAGGTLHQSQILQIYLLPLQLSILFASAALLSVMNGVNPGFISGMLILTLLTVLMMVALCAIDFIPYMQTARSRFIWRGPVTYYMILLVGLTWVTLTTDSLPIISMFFQLMP